MRTFAEFQIIGHIGQIKTVGKTRRVTIAAEYGRKDNRGDFQKNTYWNEITIFNDRTIAWIDENIIPGDLVHVRGTVRQTSFDKDGQTIYAVTLAANDFNLLAKKTENQQAA